MKVMTPKPRNAKKVSATLDTMSPKRRVPREREQVGVEVAQGGDREHGQDADHDDDDDGLRPRDRLGAEDVEGAITSRISTAKGLTQSALSATAALA